MRRDAGDRVVHTKVVAPQLARGVERDRLLAKLDGVRRHRLTLLTGPAGSGKTTLLAQYAAREPSVAWYRAEPSDCEERRFLAHLEAAVAAVTGPSFAPWVDIETAAVALDDFGRRDAVVVIDDVHDIEDSPAEATLKRLIDYAPRGLAIVVASRSQPRLNLSRLRLAGELLEIDADDLRFRSWEIERLFAEVYRQPLAPDDLAELARRTGGWAAGLQLFHLATQGKRAGECHEILRGLSSRTKILREYLAQNVLEELPSDLRGFVLDTCVLGRLDRQLCDALLDQQGSERLLTELARRQLFVVPLESGAAYRYHEVFRSYLADCLVDRIGETAVRARYRRAAGLLEAAGAASEAFVAYTRAGDDGSARRLLGAEGATVAERTGAWLDAVPAALAERDPWLLLAAARRSLYDGRVQDAVTRYRRAEDAFGTVRASIVCRTERMGVSSLLDAGLPTPEGWIGRIRRALRGETRESDVSVGGAPADQLAAAVALLVGGRVEEARTHLSRLLDDRSSSAAIVLVAECVIAIVEALLADTSSVASLAVVRERLEDVEWTWLDRVASAALAVERGWAPSSLADRETMLAAGDLLGAGLLTFFQGYSERSVPDAAAAAFEGAADLWRDAGTPALEAWARCAAAAALRLSGGESVGATLRAEAIVRTTGSRVSVARWVDLLTQAIPEEAPRAADGRDVDRTKVSIACFGDFTISVGSETLDLSALKPRVRSLLRLLCLSAGKPVDRDSLTAALWPEADVTVGVRNVQVAVSALRHYLETAAGGVLSMSRDGPTYCLAVPPSTTIDVRMLEDHLAKGRRPSGDPRTDTDDLERALAVYRGELLRVEGLAEWVLPERERYRLLAAEAAELLAQRRFDHGDFAAAASACERGIHIDRYRDGLWKTLVRSSEQAGDLATAARHRDAYARLLGELGLEPSLT